MLLWRYPKFLPGFLLFFRKAAPLLPEQQLELEAEQEFQSRLSEYEKKEYAEFQKLVSSASHYGILYLARTTEWSSKLQQNRYYKGL